MSISFSPFALFSFPTSPTPQDLIKHAKALTTSAAPMKLVFWRTSEAHDRCLGIVSKIGGIHEKRRARAIFSLGPDDPQTEIPIEDVEREYWKDSRFLHKFIPHLPICIFPTPSATNHQPPSYQFSSSRKGSKIQFWVFPGADFCGYPFTRSYPHPRAMSEELVDTSAADLTSSSAAMHRWRAEIHLATAAKANPGLRAHTMQSTEWGAELGWMTLTANRTSVEAILQAQGSARRRVLGGNGRDDQLKDHDFASNWIMDPCSLAEGTLSYQDSDSFICNGHSRCSVNPVRKC